MIVGERWLAGAATPPCWVDGEQYCGKCHEEWQYLHNHCSIGLRCPARSDWKIHMGSPCRNDPLQSRYVSRLAARRISIPVSSFEGCKDGPIPTVRGRFPDLADIFSMWSGEHPFGMRWYVQRADVNTVNKRQCLYTVPNSTALLQGFQYPDRSCVKAIPSMKRSGGTLCR
ncbi:hypothetical protein BDV98DRAFT_572120 [Pterulicium gracile]|uniref:Uncharacterized protein n=1 Tax=Pterulicium gracile TaxID=1884261 RepID=A0A5C3QF05_9AGAR|nr:hypothetical protein BDV98DRAFT_572120 [Pterula gracilis]